MVNLVEIRKTAASYATQPISRLLAKTSITPNAITWSGLLLAAVAAILIITGELFAAGVMVLVAGFFDMLDGALARLTGKVTSFGAVLDSTLDRISEALLLLGILVLYVRESSVDGSLLAGSVLVGSFMVSYVRARAESLGLDCKIGFFTRTERVIILALGLLLSRIDYALIIALATIGFFSFFTVGQRLLYAWRQTKNS